MRPVDRGLAPRNYQQYKEAIEDLTVQRHPAVIGTKLARRDKRWQDRDNVWELAEKCRENFEKLGQADEAKKLVLEVVMPSAENPSSMVAMARPVEQSQKLDSGTMLTQMEIQGFMD